MYLIHLLVALHRSKLHVPDQNVIRFKKKKLLIYMTLICRFVRFKENTKICYYFAICVNSLLCLSAGFLFCAKAPFPYKKCTVNDKEFTFSFDLDGIVPYVFK